MAHPDLIVKLNLTSPKQDGTGHNSEQESAGNEAPEQFASKSEEFRRDRVKDGRHLLGRDYLDR